MLEDMLRDTWEYWKEFQARVAAANPAPYDETPQYRAFMMWFPLTLLTAQIITAYLLSFALREHLHIVTAFIELNFPIFKDRILFLGGADSHSANAFSATMVVAVLFIPISLILFFNGYWKAVLVNGELKEVTALSAVNLLQGGAIFLVFFWIAFVDAPHSAQYSRVGTAGIFGWWIFPLLGSGICWLANGWIFCSMIGLLKALRLLGHKT